MYALGETVSIFASSPIDWAAAAVACEMMAKSLPIGAVAKTISSPVAPASSTSARAASRSYGYDLDVLERRCERGVARRRSTPIRS